MNLREFQERIGETYLRKDSDRGLFESYAWLVEEIGELAGALRHGRPEDLTHEFSDCLAWLREPRQHGRGRASRRQPSATLTAVPAAAPAPASARTPPTEPRHR